MRPNIYTSVSESSVGHGPETFWSSLAIVRWPGQPRRLPPHSISTIHTPSHSGHLTSAIFYRLRGQITAFQLCRPRQHKTTWPLLIQRPTRRRILRGLTGTLTVKLFECHQMCRILIDFGFKLSAPSLQPNLDPPNTAPRTVPNHLPATGSGSSHPSWTWKMTEADEHNQLSFFHSFVLN